MLRLPNLGDRISLLLCTVAFATLVRAQFYPAFRSPADFFRSSKCVYRSIQYNAGDIVKTGESCLNCTCSNGAIVCHLRVCTPIPDPPPTGCFIVHKKNTCCPELVCNDDNNISFDGLEGRSRPGANEEAELDLEKIMKINRTGCVINGTTYADGSALSSSTNCKYCFCLKGKEECVKPNCILQLPGCAPVYTKHACCPVRYNCHGSDNVTIISTELSSTPSNTSPPIRLAHFTHPVTYQETIFIPSNKSRPTNDETKSTTRTISTTRMMMMSDQANGTSNGSQRENSESSSLSTENGSSQAYMPSSTQTLPSSSSNTNPFTTEAVNINSQTTPTETGTEISTSISVVKSELMVEQIGDNEGIHSSPNIEERVNTFPQNSAIMSESTQPYDRSSKSNFTMHAESSVTAKTIPPELEAILNITKKKQEGDYELDYDEPTLPPSLPNLKIIPFVAADALDKPKDVTIEHRVDVSAPAEITDAIFEAPVPESGKFSPPIKTEGGFVPRDPTLDGPYFESTYTVVIPSEKIPQPITESTKGVENVNGPYYSSKYDVLIPSEKASPSPITESVKLDTNGNGPYYNSKYNGQLSHEQVPLITEPPKTVENGLCTSNFITYRHGELISEPKACNMCLCLYGEIVCQKPECPTLKPGCHRVDYTDLNNCCGEIICDDEKTNRNITSTDSEYLADTTISSTTAADNQLPNLQAETMITQPSVSPTYMTIKVKGTKNETKHKGFNSKPTYIVTTTSAPLTVTVSTSSSTTSSAPTTEKPDTDYDNGFSFENMLSYLFDEPPSPQKRKNTTKITEQPLIPSTSTSTQPTTATLIQLLESRTAEGTTVGSKYVNNDTSINNVPILEMNETDSAIYVIKKENNQYANTVVNLTDEQINGIQQVNSYYVPPLGNFEEVILNPTKKPLGVSKKPVKVNPYFSTTFRPRHTTAKVIPLNRPMEKSKPQVLAGDPGAASGLLKLSGCNIFGRMYRLGKIISELSSPCLRCMCAEIGVHCTPLKC